MVWKVGQTGSYMIMKSNYFSIESSSFLKQLTFGSLLLDLFRGLFNANYLVLQDNLFFWVVTKTYHCPNNCPGFLTFLFRID